MWAGLVANLLRILDRFTQNRRDSELKRDGANVLKSAQNDERDRIREKARRHRRETADLRGDDLIDRL